MGYVPAVAGSGANGTAVHLRTWPTRCCSFGNKVYDSPPPWHGCIAGAGRARRAREIGDLGSVDDYPVTDRAYKESSGSMTSTIGSHVVDRIMISDLVTSLAYAQDERRWDLFPRIFTSRVVVDLSAHLGSPPQELAVEELAEGARNALEGFDTTNHVVSNIRIELEEDVAHCRAYVLAYHHLREAPGPVDYCSMRGIGS